MKWNLATYRMLALTAAALAFWRRLVLLWPSVLLVESVNQCWDPIGNAAGPCCS